jgi:DNA-binding transcriptional ArsR family regulator
MSTQETGSTGPTTKPIEESPTESTTDAEGGEESPATELSLDLIFEILKNERRREVIRYLREHEQQVTLSDLAEHIAALENDTDIASITSSQRKRVYVGLYQCHLPKMADMGIVQFNQNRGIVSLGQNASQLYEYLDNQSPKTRPWHRYYLGLSGGGGALFLISLLMGGMASVVALGVFCLAIGGCSALHAIEADAGRDE